MNKIDFTFSDLIAGYVTEYDTTNDTFKVKTSDKRQFQIKFTATTYAELVRNLGEPYHDCTSQMKSMLVPNRYVFAYGIYYPDGANNTYNFEAKHLVFLGRTENEFLFEKQNWWIKEIRQLAEFYAQSEFPNGEIDFSTYRTNLTISGGKGTSGRQETDTISRLVYGFATAYLLTGEDKYLEIAEKGTEYLRKHLRFEDKSEEICYWYHAVDIQPNGTEQKIFASEFGDDYDAIPCYEQIYALAGPTQTYRVTGEPRIMSDIKATVNLFNRYFLDQSEKGGYYSHIDPITLSPHSESLGHNRARKNWNSVGDHAPAYLINLWLATGKEEYAKFLEYTFDTIEKHFPDFENSPFVNEKFFDDWSHDHQNTQLNRAIIGHDLKIAWNLMRMNSLKAKDKYVNLAKKIADLMPQVGMDKQRGGWYDMMERQLEPEEKSYRLVWHDRKAWWQQEQGILAYLILAGCLGDQEYRRIARESASFYNACFLDVESGGVYFNVLANGIPFVASGVERGKGSHSMAGYHSFELAYLAAIYTNLLITKEPMDFYFKPMPGGFEDNTLRVQPDILPPGSVRINEVWINGVKYSDFDAEKLTVKLPTDQTEIKVRVRLVPNTVAFDADLREVSNDTAKIALSGSLEPITLKYLDEAIQSVKEQNITKVVLEMEDLQLISTEALRYLLFQKQKAGADFNITVIGAKGQVKEAIQDSELYQEITMIEGYKVPQLGRV